MSSQPRKAALHVLLVGLVCGFAVSSRAADPASPLILEHTIPLAGVSGRIDHMAVDLPRKRLFIAELGNGTVDVIDIAAGTVISRIGGLREPQGIGYAPGADVIAIASAGDGSVRLLRGDDFSPVGRVDLGEDADNVRLDARTDHLVVGYGTLAWRGTERRQARGSPGRSLLRSRVPPIARLQSS